MYTPNILIFFVTYFSYKIRYYHQFTICDMRRKTRQLLDSRAIEYNLQISHEITWIIQGCGQEDADNALKRLIDKSG